MRSQVKSPLRMAARIMSIVTPPSGKNLLAAISSGIGASVIAVADPDVAQEEGGHRLFLLFFFLLFFATF